MRSILAMSLFITLYASASADTVSRSHRQHAAVRAKQSPLVGPAPGFASAPARRPVDHQIAPGGSQQNPYDNRYLNWGGGGSM